MIEWKDISMQGFNELDELQEKLHFVLRGTKQGKRRRWRTTMNIIMIHNNK